MKSLTFVSFWLGVFLIWGVLSQARAQAIEFGPHAGFTSSRLWSSIQAIREEGRSGVMAGLFLRLNAGRWYLQPEGNLMMKGGRRWFEWKVQNSTQATEKVHELLDVTSLDVPILIGLKTLNLGVLNVRVFGGPVASFIVHRDSRYEVDHTPVELVDFTEDLDQASWGLQAGAGLDFLMLTLDARFELGMKEWWEPSDLDLRTRLVMLTLGWKFR